LSETPRTRAIVVTKLIKVDAHCEGRRYIVHSDEAANCFSRTGSDVAVIGRVAAESLDKEIISRSANKLDTGERRHASFGK
jgi:hypothetical protein